MLCPCADQESTKNDQFRGHTLARCKTHAVMSPPVRSAVFGRSTHCAPARTPLSVPPGDDRRTRDGRPPSAVGLATCTRPLHGDWNRTGTEIHASMNRAALSGRANSLRCRPVPVSGWRDDAGCVHRQVAGVGVEGAVGGAVALQRSLRTARRGAQASRRCRRVDFAGVAVLHFRKHAAHRHSCSRPSSDSVFLGWPERLQ